jgi:hypothetical protein
VKISFLYSPERVAAPLLHRVRGSLRAFCVSAAEGSLPQNYIAAPATSFRDLENKTGKHRGACALLPKYKADCFSGVEEKV